VGAPSSRGTTLEIIEENTEYAFRSAAKESPGDPAHGITLCGHGVRAFKTLRTDLTALSKCGCAMGPAGIGFAFSSIHRESRELSSWTNPGGWLSA
jgi:hypothetical protein